MRSIARRVCLGVLMSALMAVPTAIAQVTTAVVAGSVKDAQDAVIPGATVSLISEARGTKVGEVVTTEKGDYVFPNVPGDTYTVQVELSGFKTLKRPGVAVSPGDRVVVPTMIIEVGALSETVVV